MNQPQEALLAPVSDPAAFRKEILETPDSLICPASEIFDTAAVRAALDVALSEAKDAMEIRKATVAILNEAQQNGRAAIGDAFA